MDSIQVSHAKHMIAHVIRQVNNSFNKHQTISTNCKVSIHWSTQIELDCKGIFEMKCVTRSTTSYANCFSNEGGKIHASIKRALVSRFVNLLKEGISYQIRYFDVIRYLAGIGSERTLEKDDKFTKYTIIELEINNG
ncbi:hypothetical protein Ahy_A09g044811 [Arachis hypogaea]|uniref:Uncharacterized protein n=1 Tax=Arachis hypogaea TaxID=3818 RepID=A0A445BKT6_ARAHY|nr:hypothetical protein Ahy_A09g044811 [Arachis hypogaea]